MWHAAFMKVRLTRIEGGERLRADSVEGNAPRAPEVGRRFVLWAPALDRDGIEDDYREVSTSGVVEIMSGGLFRTHSGSVYHVQIIDLNFGRLGHA